MNPNLLKIYFSGILFLLLSTTCMPARFTSAAQASVLVNANFSKTTTYTRQDNSYAISIMPLPLTLLQFQAIRTAQGKVELAWKTAQEMNVSHFEIEHSTDGRKWEVLGKRSAKGNQGSVESYSFIDSSPGEAANYYRLHVIDYDSKSDYSPVRLVSFQKDLVVRIYPTIAKAGSTMYMEGISPELAMVEIFNNEGKTIYRTKPYSNSFSLPCFAAGIYHLRVINIQASTIASLQKIVLY